MFRHLLLVAALVLGMATASLAQETITIKGSNGLLSATYQKPSGFIEGQKCGMVIFFHNLGSSKSDANLTAIASELREQGVATMMFDFSAHGASASEDFKMKDITLKNAAKDAAAIIDYVKKLAFVKNIGICAHGIGGVTAIISAADYGKGTIGALALLTPHLSLREDALRGDILGKTFKANDLPRKLDINDNITLGRDLLEELQKTNILEKASDYKGETLVVLGKEDTTVPYSYGDYLKLVMKNAKVEMVKDIDHDFNSKDPEKHSKAIALVVKFLAGEVK